VCKSSLSASVSIYACVGVCYIHYVREELWVWAGVPSMARMALMKDELVPLYSLDVSMPMHCRHAPQLTHPLSAQPLYPRTHTHTHRSRSTRESDRQTESEEVGRAHTGTDRQTHTHRQTHRVGPPSFCVDVRTPSSNSSAVLPGSMCLSLSYAHTHTHTERETERQTDRHSAYALSHCACGCAYAELEQSCNDAWVHALLLVHLEHQRLHLLLRKATHWRRQSE
jgi:hypothetical protein